MTTTQLSRRTMLATGLSALALPARADAPKFNPLPNTQYIASTAAPDATSGGGAQDWGHWTLDPGPRGIWLASYEKLMEINGVAPAGWQFDTNDWWIEEHGLMMEKPQFPMPPGQYLVTGDRETVSILTVNPKDASDDQTWELANGATIYDVTHLRCRAARYTPAVEGQSCTPQKAPRRVFPVSPDNPMPQVEGCNKQDYAVLFIVGVAANS